MEKVRMGRFSSAILSGTLLLGLTVFGRPTVRAADDRTCFPEAAPVIHDCISGRIAEYWHANGGLPVFGYPISAAQSERNADTGAVYLTQYFERQRFEVHPENAHPYDVLLGRLGDDQLRLAGRDWHTFSPAPASAPHFFPETRHAIGAQFWDYWHNHGLVDLDGGRSERASLALFGMPISEPEMETNSSGDTVVTQHFERARLEIHTHLSTGHQVLQGLVGNEVEHEHEHGTLTTTPQPVEPQETEHATRTAEPRETEHATETAEPRKTEHATKTAEPRETEHATETLEPRETEHATETAEPRETEHPRTTAQSTAVPTPTRSRHHDG